MDPQTYNEARIRPSLEERLESIISGAALMADSSCTRDDRRDRIVQECTVVRQALQDLLSEYLNNVSLLCLIRNTWSIRECVRHPPYTHSGTLGTLFSTHFLSVFRCHLKHFYFVLY